MSELCGACQFYYSYFCSRKTIFQIFQVSPMFRLMYWYCIYSHKHIGKAWYPVFNALVKLIKGLCMILHLVLIGDILNQFSKWNMKCMLMIIFFKKSLKKLKLILKLILTLFSMGFFGVSYGWIVGQWGEKTPPFLKPVTENLQWWNLAQLYLTLGRFKKVKITRNTCELYWHQRFFIGYKQILLYHEIQI